MSKVPPAEATPVRPPVIHPECERRGRGMREQTGRRGMGESSGEVLGNEDAGEEVVEAEEEAQAVDSLPSPNMPSQSERDDHDLTHYPYRSWCEHCVEGRGLEMGHKLGHDHWNRSVAMVSFDYMFVTQSNVYTREDWSACEERDIGSKLLLKVLVVMDMRSKAIFAHAMPSKGDDERGFAVRCLVDDVLWLGYSRVILKSDNEPAIAKLLKESFKVLRVEGVDQASEEHPPPYDPQSNGAIEVGVKLIKGHFKTLRSGLERRVGYKIPVGHPLMEWLVMHSANILTLGF